MPLGRYIYFHHVKGKKHKIRVERWRGRKAGVGRENLAQTSPEWESHIPHTQALCTHMHRFISDNLIV